MSKQPDEGLAQFAPNEYAPEVAKRVRARENETRNFWIAKWREERPRGPRWETVLLTNL